MEHKSNANLKQNITRIPEFGLEISLRTENNRTEQENNKMMFPNEESQDEWEHNKKESPEVNGVRNSTRSNI